MGDSDEEHYVTFGVPLDPLDEENLPRKKAVTIEDQYAYDAQGRRRFHGAFTGGFSAGYFNTVGTRDGWRPQQFKSSRSSKAENVAQHPEDFMDEEDTSLFGIAPKGIRATSDYMDHGQKGKKRERITRDNDGPIPGVPVLKELLRPVRDTVGVTLLKKMGWRPGQGVGPRITKNEKHKIKERNEKVKIYGCSLPQSSAYTTQSDSNDSEEDDTDMTFAPDDYEPFRCNPKDNYFGIGYTGLDRRPVLSSHVNLFDVPAFNVQDKNKKLSIRGQAFGVGAFEADDEDIYEKDDMSRYDFMLGPEHKSKSKSRWSQEDKSSTSSDCLEGFIPAKSQLECKKVFKPPELPKEYTPVHTVRKSRFYPPIERIPRTAENGRHINLNANDRARILDDPQHSDKISDSIHSKTPSVAVNIVSRSLNLYGKQQTQERQNLNNSQAKAVPSWMDKLNAQSFIKGDVIGSPSTGALQNLEEYKESSAGVETSRVIASNSAVPENDNKSMKPFLADPDKQRRFEQYLEFLKNNEKHKLATIQPLSMTEWDRDHEHVEFEQAAKLFQRSVDDASNKTVVDNDVQSSLEISTSCSAEDQMKQAAKMKMFGKLTREKKEWKPASIVCKRFNVPEPQIGCTQSGVEKKIKKFSVFDSLDWSTSAKFSKSSEILHSQEKVSTSATVESQDETSLVTHPSEPDRPSPVSEKLRVFETSYEKVFGKGIEEPLDLKAEEGKSVQDDVPVEKSQKEKSEEKKDLFRAIFLSSSSSENSESENDDEVDNEVMKSVLIGKDPAELNTQRNESPPRGIFAKLDLDSLLIPTKSNESKTRNDKNNTDSFEEIKMETVTDEGSESAKADTLQAPPDMYGPALPAKLTNSSLPTTQTEDSNTPKPVFKSVVVPKLSSNVGGKWVEREKLKKSKKEKKKHKHKSKERSKHKHKSKKDKR